MRMSAEKLRCHGGSGSVNSIITLIHLLHCTVIHSWWHDDMWYTDFGDWACIFCTLAIFSANVFYEHVKRFNILEHTTNQLQALFSDFMTLLAFEMYGLNQHVLTFGNKQVSRCEDGCSLCNVRLRCHGSYQARAPRWRPRRGCAWRGCAGWSSRGTAPRPRAPPWWGGAPPYCPSPPAPGYPRPQQQRPLG